MTTKTDEIIKEPEPVDTLKDLFSNESIPEREKFIYKMWIENGFQEGIKIGEQKAFLGNSKLYKQGIKIGRDEMRKDFDRIIINWKAKHCHGSNFINKRNVDELRQELQKEKNGN